MAKQDKSWQSRLKQPTDELAVNFVESLTWDARLYQYDIVGSLAHAHMLAEQKLITRAEFKEIKTALFEINDQITAGKFKFDKTLEDIHMVLEAALVKKTGDVGRKLHTGRSRNDQVALDTRLWLRDAVDRVDRLITDLQKAFIALADKQGQIVIPAYTHLQRAQPVLAGSYLLAFVEMLQRDRQRLADARVRVNVCPLGAGALAGSSLPLNREHVAELLGFPRLAHNSLDAVSDRDYILEFIFAAAVTAMHLSRLAEDWIIFATAEFGFLTIADAWCTSSSMMPQKKNPDMLELIRGRCGSLYGNLTAALTVMKAQPLAYNRDLQEDKKQLFDAADTIEACLQMAAAIVQNTAFNPDRIARDLDTGYLDATALAEYLVRKGIPFRTAHGIVGRLVAECELQNLRLADVTLGAFQKACDKIEDDVYQSLGPENVVNNYKTTGAAGHIQLTDQLNFWKSTLK